MKTTKKLWLIHTDKMQPWWHCILVFWGTIKESQEIFEFAQNNLSKIAQAPDISLPLFLKELDNSDIYHLTANDVEELKNVNVKRKIGDEYFIDGNWTKHEILTAQEIQSIINRIKKEAN